MKKRSKRRIAVIMTVWLVVIVLVACGISAALTYFTLNRRSEEQSMSLLKQNVEDVSIDVGQMADASLMYYIDMWIESGFSTCDIEDRETITKDLIQYGKEEPTIEINVVDKNGIIVMSSVSEYVGIDISSKEQAAEFKCLLDGSTEEFILPLVQTLYDENRKMKYAGKRFEDGSGFLQVGITEETYFDEINVQAKYSSTNRRIGEKGYLLVCDDELKIINSFHNEHDNQMLSESGLEIDKDKEYSFAQEKTKVFGTSSYVIINQVSNFYIIGVFPVKEAIASTRTMMSASLILEFVVFSILFISLFVLIRILIVKNLKKVNNSLAEITQGNLDVKIDVRETYEFNLLSDDINATVDKLKDYIADAEARIDADLAVAKAIQCSVLPTIFPPFPEYKQFELFATMSPAKQVGGDFYDFYMLGNDTLGFLIADVSGKSIPGAMFMMTAKTVIKSLAESGLSPAEVFNAANKKLCEGNDAQMFVTAWMGYLDLNTGEVHIANAGHNPPMLIRDGKAKKVAVRPNFVLAGMTRTVYKEHTIQMEKGDVLYLYTDGVTEAMNTNFELYGETRLENLLSFGENYPEPSGENGITQPVCSIVAKDIAKFTAGAEQSDDITMVCIRYLGND